MASPQVENGYTRIANELFEALNRAKLNGTQYRIVLSIIRATYGFHKTSRTLGLAFFAVSTGRHKRQIATELTTLIRRNIITVVNGHTVGRSRELQVNKNYDGWLSNADSMSENTHRGCE